MNLDIEEDRKLWLLDFEQRVSDNKIEGTELPNMQIQHKVYDNNKKIISMVTQKYIYITGAHGNTWWKPRNYDVLNNTYLALDDLFYDDVTKLIKIDYPHSTDTHSIMGEDMKKYVYNSKYKNEITTILNSINAYYNILNITDEMMEAFKNKVLKEEYNIDNSIYINEELIVKLSQQVMDELKEYIED